MFIVASFAVADGLEESTEKLASSFSSEHSLITKKGSSGNVAFLASELPSEGLYAFGIRVEATVAETQTSATVFTVVDSSGVLKEVFTAPSDGVLIGQDHSYPGTVTLTAETSVAASIAGRYSSTMFPSSWLLGSEGLLRQLSGLAEAFSFAIARDLSDSAVSSLSSAGFVVQPLIGIVEFLDSGIGEIKSDAMWVLLPSSFVIAVLAYSFIGSETSDRRHDIGIVKTIGAGRRKVLWLLIANALAISAWGGLLGLALGIALSYGVSTLGSSIFTSVFVMRAGEALLLYSFVATVGAGVAGAFVPALRMTLSKPVDDLREDAT